jgi:hypothetical protein
MIIQNNFNLTDISGFHSGEYKYCNPTGKSPVVLLKWTDVSEMSTYCSDDGGSTHL